jgi:putative ABC transport system ATP-binding protein/lipoprotein-releasing system ATP-binding protein
MRDVLVRGEDVGRVFGSGRGAVAALSQATFTIEPGETVALVGPSGSGKSTLLHLIAGLDTPTSGTIEWPALGPREALRPELITVAFQGASLLPPLTVLENVALPILLAGGSSSDADLAARVALARFEMEGLADRLPEDLSGGQSQRAGLARALAGRPRLVLTDEPTGQQDRETAGHLVNTLLEAVAEAGASLVIATHDVSIVDRASTGWTLTDGVLRTEAIACSA